MLAGSYLGSDLSISLAGHVDLDAHPDDLLACLREEGALLALEVLARRACEDADRRWWREERHQFVTGGRRGPFSRRRVRIPRQVDIWNHRREFGRWMGRENLRSPRNDEGDSGRRGRAETASGGWGAGRLGSCFESRIGGGVRESAVEVLPVGDLEPSLSTETGRRLKLEDMSLTQQ